MTEKDGQEINLPQELDIEDINDHSEEKDIIDAGYVGNWKHLEFSEKARIRPYITSIIILVWTIGIAISAMRFLATGNPIRFVPPALITGPMYIILRYYYRSS